MHLIKQTYNNLTIDTYKHIYIVQTARNTHMFVRFTNKNTTSKTKQKKNKNIFSISFASSSQQLDILYYVWYAHTHDTRIHLCIELAHEKSYFTMASVLPSRNCIISGQDHLELRLFLFFFFYHRIISVFSFLLLVGLGVWCLFHTANISILYR